MTTTRSKTRDGAAGAERASPFRGLRAGGAPPLLGALVLAVALACAPRAQGTASLPPAPKRLFEPYPAERVATVRDPHDYEGKPLCQRCHVPTGELTGDPVALCSGCHTFHMRSHPVGVVQKAAVDLPLRPGGKLACHTCHDPHQKKQLLRKPFNALCLTCHQRH